MDFRSDQLKFVLVCLLAAFVGLFVFVGSKMGVRKSGILQEISYEMARPKSFLMSLFDLDGREIDRLYKAFTHPEKQAPEAPGLDSDDGGEMSTDPAATGQEPTRTVRATTKSQKNKVEINVVERDEPAKSAENADTDKGSEANSAPFIPENKKNAEVDEVDQNPPTTPINPNQNPQNPQEPDLTYAQWRTLLNEQPTLENMRQFMIAYQAQKVTEEDYYRLTQELLEDDARVEKQAMGVYGLSGFPSARSFTLLAHYSEEIGNEARKAQIEGILDGYSELQRLPSLKAVLTSKDNLSVSKALVVLEKGIAKAQDRSPADFGEGQRAFRGRSFYPTLQIFKGFIDILEPLAKEPDQPYSPLASRLLDVLQDEKAAASLSRLEE